MNLSIFLILVFYNNYFFFVNSVYLFNLFIILAALLSLRDLSSPTRDWTQALNSERVES